MFQPATYSEQAEPFRPASASAPTATLASSLRHCYRMREKQASLADDFYVLNEHGERAFMVDGFMEFVLGMMTIRDRYGDEACRIQLRLARRCDSMDIQEPNGRRLAVVQKTTLTPLRDRFTLRFADATELVAEGNLLGHEYHLGQVATVSKRWYRVRNSYGVEIVPGQHDAVILAATICIDQMLNESR